jgi:AcrR family transcriptional regulator
MPSLTRTGDEAQSGVQADAVIKPTNTARRSILAQSRSQATRRKLIRAALRLWNERGFESFDEISAEEIATAAGVSKGTFYFHFARKEDVVLEMSLLTVQRMEEEAEAAMERGDSCLAIAEELMTSLARRVSRTPRPAVQRVSSQWARTLQSPTRPSGSRSLQDVWSRVVAHGCARGDLPMRVEVDELAALLQVVSMDGMAAWAATTDGEPQLRQMLTRRAELILRGAAAASW